MECKNEGISTLHWMHPLHKKSLESLEIAPFFIISKSTVQP